MEGETAALTHGDFRQVDLEWDRAQAYSELKSKFMPDDANV